MILAALFSGKYFIVDSNILRMLRRLNVISMDADIYEARREPKPYIRSDRRIFLHVALVSLGQRVCRVKNPICDKRPLNGDAHTLGEGAWL